MAQSTKEISPNEIIAAAMKLPSETKLKLVEQLLDSVEPLDQAEIDRAWVVEVRRRLKDLEEGKAHTIPAEDVFAAIDARLKP
jgi:putative addiction module component (TIGR02574 family)